MRILSPDRLLQFVGLSEALQIATGDRWRLFMANEHRAFGQERVYILYFDSRATWEVVTEASTAVRSHVANQPVHVVVQKSANVSKQLERLRTECRAASARTVTQLLQSFVERMLGAARIESDSELQRLFVDPDIEVEDESTPVKAIDHLFRWLTAADDQEPRVGVLIAGAGIGKTTVTTNLFHRLLVGKGSGQFPLLIQSDQWAKLSDRATLSLWDIWRESLDVLYASTINRDDFETCVESGSLLPILDGFDELCTRLGAHFSASETLGQLLDLVADTEGRLLLTTRDTFWLDNISIDRRQAVVHFNLLPFNKPQTAKYFENRFQHRLFQKRDR